MNDPIDQKRLLEEVLDEASSPDFRAAMLGETLRLVRRRRRWRQVRQTGGVVAVLLLAAWLAWPGRQPVSPTRPMAKAPATRNYQLVETQPLPAADKVETRNFPAVKMISSEASVKPVVTVAGAFRSISDDELLAFTAPKPAVLIRTGPKSEDLVFADDVSDKQ